MTASPGWAPGWLRRLTAELEANDARATALAQDLSVAQLNWHPPWGGWSAGQCLEHLRVATAVYLMPMGKALDNAPRAPVEEITIGWFGRWFIAGFIEPSPRQRRHPAPRTIRPGPDVPPDMLARFLASNEDLRAFLARAAPCDVNRIRFRNPFVPLIRFTIGTGLEILTRHQRRHLNQAERIARAGGWLE